MTRPVLLLSFLTLLAVATPARADESTAARDAAAPTSVTPRIRATHRVDVIAPGEKVESVIDRMRTRSTGPVRDGRPAEPAPAGERRGERGLDSRPMGTSGAMMGGGGTPGAGTAGATQGSTSGGMPGMGTAGGGGAAPRGDVPPPDRMRRR
jgi:hypothetical protein